MENIDFSIYFDDTKKYYNPEYIIIILENILKSKLDSIKNDVNNANVQVDKDQIINYLETKFAEENPELKKRIEKAKLQSSSIHNLTKMTAEDIHNSAKKFADKLEAQRYSFEPYTLKYFQIYSSIVKKKTILLLDIIEKIGNRNIETIKDLLVDLDINLDEYGNITKEDIIRLITPALYNIYELNKKVTSANTLSTYLDFKIYKHLFYKRGISESEIYPNDKIQNKSLVYYDMAGDVPLSINQKEQLEKQYRKNIKDNAKFIISMWD